MGAKRPLKRDSNTRDSPSFRWDLNGVETGLEQQGHVLFSTGPKRTRNETEMDSNRNHSRDFCFFYGVETGPKRDRNELQTGSKRTQIETIAEFSAFLVRSKRDLKWDRNRNELQTGSKRGPNGIETRSKRGSHSRVFCFFRGVETGPKRDRNEVQTGSAVAIGTWQ